MTAKITNTGPDSEPDVTLSSGSYKPKISTSLAYGLMQAMANNSGMSIEAKAKDLGFDCPYSWMLDVLESLTEGNW